MPWNVKQTELLKTLVTEGMRCSRMALEISLHGDKVTRNAVIGKMHRMGYSRSPLAMPGPRRTKAEQARDNSVKMSIMRKEAKAAAPSPKRAPSIPKEPPYRPTFRGVSLLELGARECRFPRGDRAPFTFCGAPTHATEADPYSSYCHYHQTVTHSALPPRRSIRPAA